jgi:hypothetical protein
MPNKIICLLVAIVVGCQPTIKQNDKKVGTVSFDFMAFNNANFRMVFADTVPVITRDSLFGVIQNLDSRRILMVKNTSDSSIWVYYLNWGVPQLSPEKVNYFTIDSFNNRYSHGGLIVDSFGAIKAEIKSQTFRCFMTYPQGVSNQYPYYEINYSYAKKENSDSLETYVLKCKYTNDSLFKVE